MDKKSMKPIPLQPKLYAKAVKKADEVYNKHSAYKSMYISKVYVSLGGTYSKKGSKGGGVKRWNQEKWIQVLPYLKYGKKVACGADNKVDKVCRPYVRVNKSTPITLPELMKMHKKKDLIKLAEKKVQMKMKGRVFWKTLKYYPNTTNKVLK